MSLRVLMFHGKEGSPTGGKATHVRDCFGEAFVSVPNYQPAHEPVELALPRCVRLALSEVHRFQPDVLVGSSFGGAVLLTLLQDHGVRVPSIILAGAGGLYGLPAALPEMLPVIVAHGVHDTIVDLSHSQALAASSASARLVELDDGHRLGCTTDSPTGTSLLEQWINELSTPQSFAP